MRLTILGCGGSGGVPLIGGRWGACDPTNPRNRRRRVSALIETDRTRILIDTGPDLREQLLDAGVGTVDAVLYTHAHADHLHGIDDLRAVNRNMRRPIPAYGSADTLRRIAARFGYAFEPIEPDGGFYKPTLLPHAVEGPFAVGDIPVIPFVQDHGFSATLGFRFGPVAYSTDVVDLPEEAFSILHGVEVWVVDCLRDAPHPTHAHLARTLAWIDRVRPGRAVLTHMDIGFDYAELAARLPAGVEPGYDGMVIEI